MRLVERARGSITDYDEAKRWHEDACRQWQVLSRCWYWLSSVEGVRDARPFASQARNDAERDRVLHGWEPETLEQARSWNMRNPIPRFPYRKPKKSVATTAGRSFESEGDGDDMRDRLRQWTPTPMVARDWMQQFGDDRAHIAIMQADIERVEAVPGGSRAAAFYRGRIADVLRGMDSVAALVGPVSVEQIDVPAEDDRRKTVEDY